MYVIKTFGEYWIRDRDDETIEEIYDLREATKFRLKRDAKALIERTALREYSEIVKYEEAIGVFEEWLANGMVRRPFPKFSKEWGEYNGEGLNEIIEFKTFAHINEDAVSYEVWSSWPQICSVLKNFYDIEFYVSEVVEEINEHTLERSFEVMVRPDASFSVFLEEFKLLLPYITYIDRDGYKTLSIFDHECDKYDFRYLSYKSDDSCKIISGRKSYDPLLFKGTLEECFNKIRESYYYEH